MNHLKNTKFERPTKYSSVAIQMTNDYCVWCIENDECSFAEGLALKLNVDDPTLRHWANRHKVSGSICVKCCFFATFK